MCAINQKGKELQKECEAAVCSVSKGKENEVILVIVEGFRYCVCGARFRIVQGGSNMTGTNCDLFTHK